MQHTIYYFCNMEKLREKYLRLLNSIDYPFKRFLFEEIDWNSRFIIVKGQRGTGKTTLILQSIKLRFDEDLDKTLYVSLDDIYFSKNTVTEIADEFYKDGGKYLFIDEVHRYKNWAQELKNIYDFYPGLKLIVTGSSAIDFHINISDLGRRAAVYTLPELSFREYLNLFHSKKFTPFMLEDIIARHQKIAVNLNAEIRSLKLFRQYLAKGAYPFILNDESKFYEKLEAIVNTVIDSDIPSVENITYESRIKLKKLLLMLAGSSPFKINFSELSRKLETTRDMLVKYLHLLNQSGILIFLSTDGIGHTVLRKPDKIYLSNSNILYALSDNVNIGTIRETFFLNQLVYSNDVRYPKTGDFVVNGKYTFEIGGKNKTQKQISGVSDSFLVLDDIEYGSKNRIPLWLFGFLY